MVFICKSAPAQSLERKYLNLAEREGFEPSKGF